MNGWWFVFAYGMVAVFSWRPFTMSTIEAIESGLGLDGGFDLFMAMLAGFVMALCWPVAWPGRAIYRRVRRSPTFLSQRQRREAAERALREAQDELARAKRAAQAMGLPWPSKEES